MFILKSARSGTQSALDIFKKISRRETYGTLATDMHRAQNHRLALLLSCALFVLTNSTFAQTPSDDQRAKARVLGYAGLEAYQRAEYPTAEKHLNEAFALLPAPSLGLWSARAMARVGHLVEASQRYMEVAWLQLEMGEADVQGAAKVDAERERATLLPLIPTVLLRLEGATWSEVTVQMDGVALAPVALGSPISANPGKRVFEARRGQDVARVTVVLGIGERKMATLRLERGASSAVSLTTPLPRDLPRAEVLDRDPSADAFDWRTVGWVGLGTGGTALVFSGIAGLVAAGKKGNFDCSGDPCVHDNQGEIDEYETFVTLATVGYLSGAVLAGAGLWILLDADAPENSVKVSIGLGSAGVEGVF